MAATSPTEAYKGIVEALQVHFEPELVPHMFQLVLCESSGRQSATHLNSNGTTDHGLMQINSVHDKEARELGLDFRASMEDNILMAKRIFERQSWNAWKVCSKKVGIS